MGQPADLASGAASTHSLQNVSSDDLAPPSYEQVTAESSSQPSTNTHNANATYPTRLIDVDTNIPGGSRAVSASSRVRDTTIVTLYPELSSNPRTLYTAFAQQIHLPPRPQLLIAGTHTDSTKKKQDKKNGSDVVTDFDFRVDLAETLLKGWESLDSAALWHTVEVARDFDGVKTYRGTRLKTASWASTKRNVSGRLGPIQLSDNEGVPEDDDEERRLVQPETDEQGQHDRRFVSERDQDDFMVWCERFCHDPSPVKSFTLHRQVCGFNHQAVINCLKSHIRDINYRGAISMQLVVSKSTITVYSPHWINRLRNHGVVYWVFILTQLWILAWPVIWLLERRYEVVNSSWYASCTEEDSTGHSRARTYAHGRDEHALGEFWAPAVKQAAWARRTNGEIVSRDDAQRLQGLTTEQLLRGTVGSDSQAEIERRQRMQRGEGSFVDSVVGLARGVNEVRQGWNMSMGWGGNV
ncbi:hypothetical protein PISL3812_08658 [Talaromyces islandicus]|uniref:Uncharacterized protein n=1 Tax=Talaromyces islandicus TaxID=28573 RepID=A0A0U1M7V3_TALIS|nr:hypothetical protein PISL3812_08658 [Talaromyces islandicus]